MPTMKHLTRFHALVFLQALTLLFLPLTVAGSGLRPAGNLTSSNTTTAAPLLVEPPVIDDLFLKRKNFIIDEFEHKDHNTLGFWHGPGEDLDVEYGRDEHGDHYVRLDPSDPDQNFHSQLSGLQCTSLKKYKHWYLHVEFSGSSKFSISLNQNNKECRPGRNPYPATWDTVEAKRYAKGNHIYVPLSHFSIDKKRVVSVSFNGFYTEESVTLHKIEIVKHLPRHYSVPVKLPNGNMILKCTRPNSFAFGIDDGQPYYAQEIMEILDEEDILVTFFVVGRGLREKDTNFTQVYKEMLRRGHQIASHSNTHRKMEGLQTEKEIDEEIVENIEAFKELLGIESKCQTFAISKVSRLTSTAKYFRPPYGTVGARMRQRLAAKIYKPYIVNWSVDIEDWLWANTDTPEKQLDAFWRDLMRGGNLAVMHYLSESTVDYFREFIRMVKSSGMHIMRIDQCLEDPRSPPVK